MKDTEIIERYFVARGLAQQEAIDMEMYDFPEILTDFPAFIEHVIIPMEANDLFLKVDMWDRSIAWVNRNEDSLDYQDSVQYISFKDFEVLKAAVIGATEYYG